jgi:tetratricopeptide (TPR) repeat protein
MSTAPAGKFTSLVRARKPDALELFTDRTDEQQLLRRVLSARPTGELEGGWTNLLTVFYGVGGVGKTTLRKQARKIAREEFPDCTCVVTDFDGEGWTPDRGAAQVFAELCRGLLAEKIAPVLTLTLLALDRHSGEKGVSLDDRYGLVFAALDKGVEWAAIPGLGEALKGVRWLAKHAYARSIRERINALNLSPEEHEGKVNLLDLQAKLPLALYHDVSGWLAETPGRRLVWLLDGYERIQSRQVANDGQSRLREFIREFGAQQQGDFRAVVFGREQLNWAELYQEPWADFSNEHCLGGLAESDARHFLAKSQAWLQGHGQGPLADAIARYADRILDASDERVQGQRAFYPFYLNLSLDLVERALAARREPDLGGSPAELQERFFRYLGPQEKRALQVLALAEVFDAELFDWLVTRQLVAGFTVHGFDAELRKERSYFLPVEREPGRWKFHKLMEDALHASCRSPAAERTQGQELVRELLEYFGGPLKEKPEREWTDADAERWRRGMEILVTQGPELGLFETEKWHGLMTQSPWATEHFRCLAARVDFARRVLSERERKDGPEHPDTLRSAMTLGNALFRVGEFGGAEDIYQRVLKARETILGTEHHQTLNAKNDLAAVRYKRGDYAGAERLFRQTLAAKEKALGSEHPSTLTAMHNLAVMLRVMSNYAGSEELSRRTLAARERVLGLDHYDTLKSLRNLAVLRSEMGDCVGAEGLCRRTLAAREKVLGPDHPETILSMNDLAHFLRERADYIGAEQLHRRALAGYEKALGPDHPDTLSSVNGLAVLLGAQGDYAGAEPLYRRALAGREKALGPEHPDTLRSVNNLAICFNGSDRLGEARNLLRAWAGKSAAGLRGVRYNLARYECLSGNLDEARRLIADELAAHPERKAGALADPDLAALHSFLETL